MSKPIKEALKELGRVCLMAVIPILIVQLESGKMEWKVIAVSGVVAGLRFIDKLMYETGKATDNKALKGGLARF